MAATRSGRSQTDPFELEAEALRRAQLPVDRYLAWRPGLLLAAYDTALDQKPAESSVRDV